ncbi:Gfo/Idh/MocA family protein [Granulicella sibirica]|uniref:Epimerase n=1 Tax=Granulicella sibirica TaxID=2479048 RepID=A0A4Q0SX66_9BACT|nr:Gfo/Idh/MocA family oxidoreductase [Granulicella sibirica]RXH54560.1 epimerase [Granulicella sibirica]
MGLIGPGFVAAHHIDAVRRLGNVDVVALAGSSQASAEKKAKDFRVDKAYGSYEALLADPSIDVVHNTTPNYMHLPVTLAALRAGKHVISDKPLALNAKEGLELRDAALASGKGHVVTFNYRGNPLVQQARQMVSKGEMGDVTFVHGHYLQDWMADPGVYSWRSDPSKGGLTSALGDIGSHWCDLAEHMAGVKIVSVLAELTTVISTRFSAGASAEAFTVGGGGERTAVTVQAEDLATVLLRFEKGVKGVLSVGQVLPGHKNDLQVEVNGRNGSLKWLQERQNELWIGHHDKPNEMMAKDPSLVAPEVRKYVHLPGGHQEGWADAFFNLISDAYEWIGNGAIPAEKPGMLPTFEDGYRSTCLVEAMLKSHASGGVWTDVQHVVGGR